MPSLIEQSGGQPQKQPKYVPIFMDRSFTGLFTQRNVLHDPSDVVTAKFYGGRPDALWSGLNVELTNRLTLQRRPGLVPFSTATYPSPVTRTFSFSLTNGTIQVIVDTGSTGAVVMSASTHLAGFTTTTYSGTFPLGASNGYVGMKFTVSGFTNPGNNGTFIVLSSTITTLGVWNPNGVTETTVASMISTGAVYVDNQDGTKTCLMGKSVGAGQTYFVAVAGLLYMGNGVDTKKYVPGNPNANFAILNLMQSNSGTAWNWGIVAPTTPPSVQTVQSAANAVVWQANTYYSSFGLIVDTTVSPNQVLQLYTVNADGSNPTSRYGTSSNGQPAWNQNTGGTTTDGGVTWTNQGPIGTWTPKTTYQPGAAIYEPGTKCIFIMTHNFACTSGPSAPAWNPALVTTGARTSEFNAGGTTAARWGSLGQVNGNPTLVKSWTASTPFLQYIQPSSGNDPSNLNCAIIEPSLVLPPAVGGPPVYLQGATTAGTTASGGTPPPWPNPPVTTVPTADGQLGWVTVCTNSVWQAATQYNSWVFGSQNFGVVKDANGNLQVATTLGGIGTTASVIPGTTGTLTAAGNASGGNTSYTGVAMPIFPLGSPVTISGFVTAANNGRFKIVTSTATTLVVTNGAGVAETHAGVATYNPWGTTYGATTQDNGVLWTCVGASVAWAANSIWYLPVNGFAPPSSSQKYGGSSVIDTNTPSDVQFVISSGKSGAGAHPTWLGIGVNTTDNTITWYNTGVAPTQTLVWKTGHVYAYSFKARALTDFYSVSSTVNGVTGIPFPPGSPNNAILPVPIGSQTGAVSTASTPFIIVGGNTGAVNTVSGLGSTDPQVDTIIIWRDADGGGSGQMFELTEIPAPAPINGVAQPWFFQDYLPDTPTVLYPTYGLNTLIPAPINLVNNPPISTFLPQVYNFTRIWGADQLNVDFSRGPDSLVGNPNENFAPTNTLPFLAPVIRIVKTPQGLVTFLSDSIEVIAGGPLTTSFFSVTWAPGIGLRSFNMLDVLAGEIYFFSADNQFRIMSPSLNISNAGFALGDQFANNPSSGVPDTTWNSNTGYVASHQNGVDNCIFVADGSTGWYRLNPHQAGAKPETEPVWSPFAVITGGCQMVQSVQTAPGIKKLLVGAATSGQSILNRSLTTFTDNGTPYPSSFVMGSIMLAHPGQLALLKFMEFDFNGVSYQPTVSYLLNEISGAFTPFTAVPVFDPPSLYGTTITPATYSPNRYYFMGNASLARCRHLQIKIDFGTTSVGNEMFNATIFGRIMIET